MDGCGIVLRYGGEIGMWKTVWSGYGVDVEWDCDRSVELRHVEGYV